MSHISSSSQKKLKMTSRLPPPATDQEYECFRPHREDVKELMYPIKNRMVICRSLVDDDDDEDGDERNEEDRNHTDDAKNIGNQREIGHLFPSPGHKSKKKLRNNNNGNNNGICLLTCVDGNEGEGLIIDFNAIKDDIIETLFIDEYCNNCTSVEETKFRELESKELIDIGSESNDILQDPTIKREIDCFDIVQNLNDQLRLQVDNPFLNSLLGDDTDKKAKESPIMSNSSKKSIVVDKDRDRDTPPLLPVVRKMRVYTDVNLPEEEKETAEENVVKTLEEKPSNLSCENKVSHEYEVLSSSDYKRENIHRQSTLSSLSSISSFEHSFSSDNNLHWRCEGHPDDENEEGGEEEQDQTHKRMSNMVWYDVPSRVEIRGRTFFSDMQQEEEDKNDEAKEGAEGSDYNNFTRDTKETTTLDVVEEEKEQSYMKEEANKQEIFLQCRSDGKLTREQRKRMKAFLRGR